MNAVATSEGHHGDEFGRVESRGIDFVPVTERHGRPRELFAIWAASNVNYLYLVLGGLLTLFGLNFWQGAIVVVIGNLFWIPIGILAISGASSGTPSAIVTRTMFGVRGNRLYVGLAAWPIFIAYEAINLVLGALAGYAALDAFGVDVTTTVKVIVLVVTSAATLAISVYGHATIVRLSGPITVALTVCMAIVGYAVMTDADFNHVVDGAPTGSQLLAVMIAGITVIASAPLSWQNSPDLSRYLPADSKPRDIAFWTAAGGFVPAVLLGVVGVAAGTVIDMSDPQTSLESILPDWFYPAFLIVIVVGAVANNVLTMYSSGLVLQAMGLRVRRSITVTIDGVLGIALAVYAIFVSNFVDTLSESLELSVVILGPSATIYVADIWMRRNRYDGVTLNDSSADSPFWFHRGFNVAGLAAFLAGAGAALLCVSTTNFSGPVAKALNGADISPLVGSAVAGLIYWAATRALYGTPTRRAKVER